MTRITVSTPKLFHTFDTLNKGRLYAEQVKPFNFVMSPHAGAASLPEDFALSGDRYHSEMSARLPIRHAAQCLNHSRRRSVQVRWVLYWPPLAAELGRTKGVERQQGFCATCLASLADGERHRRKEDDSYWKLLPADHVPTPRDRPTRR
jgi:hypothetical protein